jgi:phage gp29-like protein
MADMDNPYGVAVLSACFWVWTFKTGGWRTFVKYCERHGLPWPVGRYPMGTDDKEIDRFEAALANMLEASYVVTQEGNGLELLVPSGSGAGALPQRELIALANRELSKALTGQAMVAELDGAGARAASETALTRQESIDDSVRDIAAASMGDIFRWITLFNFGDGVAPPTLEFFKQENAGADRAGVYEAAHKLGARPSRKAFLEEMGIPEADSKDPDDAFPAAAGEAAAPAARQDNAPGTTQAGTLQGDPGAGVSGGEDAGAGAAGQQLAMAIRSIPGFEFARAGGMTEAEAIELAATAADRAIEDRMIEPVARMLAEYEAQGRSLEEFAADLGAMVGAMDDEGLREVLDRAFSYHVLAGAASNAA